MQNNHSRFNLPPGKILGQQYRVLEFLGHGWEGEVYKVEERSTGIIRAAKLFYEHRYNNQLPHLLYAKKLYKLRSCPIVIQYHYHGRTTIQRKTMDFLVSDFVEGQLLSQYIANSSGKRLRPFEALHLFYALVQGVEHIHFLGEYHGDIHSDNIIIKRKGLGFEIQLIDFLHLGKSSKAKIQQDVYDLVNVFYEMLGGQKHYHKMSANIRQVILGRKHSLIAKKFKIAGHLRLYLENLAWG